MSSFFGNPYSCSTHGTVLSTYYITRLYCCTVCLLQLAAGERTFIVDMLHICRPKTPATSNSNNPIATTEEEEASAIAGTVAQPTPELTKREELLEEALAGVLGAPCVVKVGLGPKVRGLGICVWVAVWFLEEEGEEGRDWGVYCGSDVGPVTKWRRACVCMAWAAGDGCVFCFGLFFLHAVQPRKQRLTGPLLLLLLKLIDATTSYEFST